MAQQQQQEFQQSLEEALSWMRAVQDRLRANDNTQGPRDALEARLRETEKIQHSEYEGRLKMEAALLAAESLLQDEDEELKSSTHLQLRDLKTLWEETGTYIVHCHSRIEWVWLHWSEFLKACEELQLWLVRQRRGLDAGPELQPGLREKLWQLDQQRVAVSDVHGQAALLERLLDEAAALHNRTQDPSLDPQAQERLREDYNEVRDRAEERLALLQKVSEEHQQFQTGVQRFQSWLLTKTRELTELMEQEEPAESKLHALQVLDEAVACEEKTLQQLELVADGVRSSSSPLGAAAAQEEAEELRLGWQRLRQGLAEAGEGLRGRLDAHGQYLDRCRRLGDDIGRLRGLLQGLDRELGGTRDTRENRDQENRDGTPDPSEDQMVGRWRKYTGVRNTLVLEESQVEQLKSQLKDLFRFSGDSRHLSDDVLAVVREHQSVKCRATRLVSESELGLRSFLQDPLLLYGQWSHAVATAMEGSANVNDFCHIALQLQRIQGLLEDGSRLQERLALLQVKGELLDSVFGPDRSDGLQGELSSAVRNRELLQEQLLQRKSRLQGLISRTKDFDEAYGSIRTTLAGFRERLQAIDVPQPDILAKKSRLDQLMVVHKDLEDLESHIVAMETLVSSSQSNRSRLEKLHGDWTDLHRTVTAKAIESEDAVCDHECFHGNLLGVEKWMMVMRQKLESFSSPAGGWSVEGRRHEAERALGEFPEKEQQLQQTEVQAQLVLAQTAADGQVHILRDLERLRDLWVDLYDTSLNLHRLLSGSTEVDSGSFSGEPEPEPEPDLVPAVRGCGLGLEAKDGSVFGEGRGEASMYAGSGPGPGSGPGSGSEPGPEPGPGSEPGPGAGPGSGSGVSNVFMKSSASPSTVLQGRKGSRWNQFEDWLSRENQILSGVINVKEAELSDATVKTRQETLQGLRSRVSWGQDQFQLLLQESADGPTDPGLAGPGLAGPGPAGPGPAEDVSLEELRYRWMLYKSKLKDVVDIRARRRTRTKKLPAFQDELAAKPKPQKEAGLLQRVCRLALLFWLLLLALLLLSFLLPLMDDGTSCSLANNFARSFSVMLRYDGPPPT
ncbi:nesprin-3 isoform X2 [Cololabis saira]|uniref:nesprin-3 isoform X2 n=1 Tax=Cololabis saira TaxID=129043 RepID=UPI002AD22678|nr:nesprin-3 isoform X2 [Cololabis saira]